MRFAVRHEGSEEEPLAVYCASLGSLERGEYCLCFIFVGSTELMTFLVSFHRDRIPASSPTRRADVPVSVLDALRTDRRPWCLITPTCISLLNLY